MLNWDDIKNNGWKAKNGKEFKILSIDGGGIRGIYPAQYLANIEKETGKKINEYFDLIVGTSTGGIIALGLSIGIAASDIVELYMSKCQLIFNNKLIRYFPILKTPFMAFRNLYKNDGLKKELKDIFKDKKIKDADVMLCIPSLDNNSAKPRVYKTPHNPKFHYDKDIEMWKVALATSAAPLYFNASEEEGSCKFDGGLWANNPIVVGITEALNHDIKKENINVLSIGTGNTLYNLKGKTAKKGGLISWNKNLVDLVMNAQSYSAENISSYLIDSNNIVRINFETSKKLDMDDISIGYLKDLKDRANTSFQETYRNIKNVESKFFN